MNKFLIATHGAFASGSLSTIEIITGDVRNIKYIDAFTEKSNLPKDLNMFVQSIDDNDVGVIFTDLKGGSVNQQAFNTVGKSKKKNIFIITGFNLPLLLSLVLKTDKLTKHEIDKEVEEAKQQLELLEIGYEDSTEMKNGFFN